MIAAVARNGGIGFAGQLPWHLPEDLRRFKQLTTGHTVLMGRKTYESLGRPLPHRRNVVISSGPVSGVESYRSVQEGLAALAGEEQVFVIGGAQLYAQLLSRCDELYLTLVDRDIQADVFFPPYQQQLDAAFRLVSREEREGFTFVHYRRIDSAA